jgi:predicted nuclease of predicted toxin-antitoxin system
MRQRGIDVTTASDAKLLGATDAAHLAFATAHQRVLMTHDHDFLLLHAMDSSHAGIAYCHQVKYSVGELIRLRVLLQRCNDADDMKGRVEFL